jgi:hypothetical protein
VVVEEEVAILLLLLMVYQEALVEEVMVQEQLVAQELLDKGMQVVMAPPASLPRLSMQEVVVEVLDQQELQEHQILEAMVVLVPYLQLQDLQSNMQVVVVVEHTVLVAIFMVEQFLLQELVDKILQVEML